MAEFALLIGGAFKEIRHYDEKPENIPHKGVTWHDVEREFGAPFEGLVNGAWIIRTVDPATLPPPVPESITRRQCALQLLAMKMITSDEALAMTKDGTPPAAVDAVFAQMPADQALLARIDFAAVGYYRDNPLITTMMQANGMTPEQIDAFFIAAAQL
jgi:hypothetical protein